MRKLGEYIDEMDLILLDLYALWTTPLFESRQLNESEQKELAKVVRENISNLSRNIGKLDRSLSTEPPKVFRDKSVADSYIEKVWDNSEIFLVIIGFRKPIF